MRKGGEELADEVAVERAAESVVEGGEEREEAEQPEDVGAELVRGGVVVGKADEVLGHGGFFPGDEETGHDESEAEQKQSREEAFQGGPVAHGRRVCQGGLLFQMKLGLNENSGLPRVGIGSILWRNDYKR